MTGARQEKGESWEAVIGLEVHVRLATKSKLFSGAASSYGAPPNATACAVDMGLPGVLPVPNREAIAMAIRFGLALGARIDRQSVFARKHYFYPDLPKGYQISQYEQPIVADGVLLIEGEQGERPITVVRAHLEEDAGKSLHEGLGGASGIDLNRAGTPLLEVVSGPQMHSPAEAGSYLRRLHTLVRWLGICDGNMQEGSFRCDANVSVRRAGTSALGTRSEIKNVNSFRFVEKAIAYEIERQIAVLESGGTLVQETRLFDPGRGETRRMRGKEEAMDYRYFPDPDLLPVAIEESWIEAIRESMPELPDARRQRLEAACGLPRAQAALLTSDKDLADYFEAVLTAGAPPALAANWVTGELLALHKGQGAPLVPPAWLATLLARLEEGAISRLAAKEMLETAWQQAEQGEQMEDCDALIDRLGLRQVRDEGVLHELVEAIIADNPNQVAEYRQGKERLLGYFVGQAMKRSAGRGDPKLLGELFATRLACAPTDD